MVSQGSQEGCTCTSRGPLVSSGPQFESLQDVGPSLCPQDTSPQAKPLTP